MIKKASLSLSLNALVILILAITILGLALSFMRGVFTEMEAKVKVAVSSKELSNPPTLDNPITVTPFKLELKQGEVGEVIVAFMNPEPYNYNFYLNVTDPEGLSCTDPADPCVVPMVYSTDKYSMRGGQTNTWAVAFSPVKGATPTPFGTYLYTTNIVCGAAQGCDPELRFTKDIEVIIKV